MKTEDSNPASSLGPIKERKPSVATNLSFIFAGMGQVYCGCLKRGVLHMCVLVAMFFAAIFALATQSGTPVSVLLWVVGLSLAVTIYSAYDARKLARQTRPDYRLKDYNSVAVYVAIGFLFMGVAGGFAISLRENFIHLFVMEGDSMSPTVDEGDRMLVRKDVYRDKDPERNDLVAFRNPTNRRQTWVKRVIGLPGDTIEIKGGAVYLNGKAWDENPSVRPDKGDVPLMSVPEHHCYVLGDHRANSKDSRMIGAVPMIALVGKVVFVR